ncbi:hypothetical protein WJX82_011418 [Trebouxia sp. C0006]
MLFAAVQHKLLTSGQAEHLAAAEGLHKRLTTADRLILETLHSQFGEWFGMSTAGAYPGLTRLQNSKSRSAGREKSSALTILRWLDQVVADNQLDLLVFLRFINRRVFLSVTVTDDPELAIRQFADLNYSGKPLGNPDVLRALLVQGMSEKRMRNNVLNTWKQVAKSLDKRHNTLLQHSCTQAWQHPGGLMLNSVKRGRVELEPTLMDELLEHMRTLADPDRTLASAEQLEFYVHQYPVMANQTGFNASKEVSEAFVFEHLQPYSEALIAMLSVADSDGTLTSRDAPDRAADKWARGAVYNMLCLPHQEWRAAALLAITLARKSSTGGAAQLQSFLRELECLSVALTLQQHGSSKRDIYLDVIKRLQAATKHQSFNAMRIAEEVFQPIWLEPEYKLKGKRDCLSRLKSKNLYSSNSRALVNTILLAAEHQMALGPDERNQISHFWEGDISIEHVLPQNPDSLSNWYKTDPNGPGWTQQSHEHWLNRLGNLCILSPGLGMASTEAVVLLPKTEYFIGNTQSPDDASLIVVASRAVSDRHARMVTGDCSSSFSPNLCRGTKQVTLKTVEGHTGTKLGNFLDGSLLNSRNVDESAVFKLNQTVVFGDDEQCAAFRLDWLPAGEDEDAAEQADTEMAETEDAGVVAGGAAAL